MKDICLLLMITFFAIYHLVIIGLFIYYFERKEGLYIHTPNSSNSLSFETGNITNPVNYSVGVEAVVNAANRGVCTGSGVTGALVNAVGGEVEWDRLKTNAETINGPISLVPEPQCSYGGPLSVCEAVIMPSGGKIGNTKYIISAAGPQSMSKVVDVEGCYKNIIELADKFGVKTIVSPFISSGIFAGSNVQMKEQVIKLSIEAVKKYLPMYPSVQKFIFTARPQDTLTINISKKYI